MTALEAEEKKHMEMVAIDAEVARAMGLKIVGWSDVYPDHEEQDVYHVGFYRDSRHTQEQETPRQRAVYVGTCICDLVDLSDPSWQDYDPAFDKAHGHHNVCLNVVPLWSQEDHLALEVLHYWRDLGDYCCIKITSDYNYVWSVNWSYANDPNHTVYYLEASYNSLAEGICKSFLEAERKRKELFGERPEVV